MKITQLPEAGEDGSAFRWKEGTPPYLINGGRELNEGYKFRKGDLEEYMRCLDGQNVVVTRSSFVDGWIVKCKVRREYGF